MTVSRIPLAAMLMFCASAPLIFAGAFELGSAIATCRQVSAISCPLSVGYDATEYFAGLVLIIMGSIALLAGVVVTVYSRHAVADVKQSPPQDKLS